MKKFSGLLAASGLFVLSFGAAFGAEGDLLFADEMTDGKESSAKYAMYLNGEKPIIDRRNVQFGNGVLTLKNTRIYTLRRDFSNFELSLEFRMVSDLIDGGKHRGFSGIMLRPRFIRPEDKGREDEERVFRIFCQPGRTMVLHDIETRSKLPRRTAGQRNLKQSLLPVFEIGRWYSMQIRAVGQTVSIAVDGVELGTVPEVSAKDRFNDRGGLALWSHAGVTEFRNIIVRELASEGSKGKASAK